MKSFNETIWLEGIKDYYTKAKKIQDHKFAGIPTTAEEVNDDLMWNIPIYDVVNRKYAAFNTLITALWYKEDDPKGNGYKYKDVELDLLEWIFTFYTFRLTGSGINYKSNHGFGNCIHQHMLLQCNDIDSMIEYIKNYEGKIADTKGYQLPTISYKHIDKGHLKYYMHTDAPKVVKALVDYLLKNNGVTIVQCADFILDWHTQHGFKRYKFVATATAMDIAEMFPELVIPDSEVYVGSNAIRCLNLTMPKKKGVNTHTWYNDCLDHLIDITGASIYKYDAEDTLGCDPIRYFQEYQSKDHIMENNGYVYKNNSIMKDILGEEEYYNKANNLK